MASVSHELRTPLNASICMLEMVIEDDKLSPEIIENFIKPSYFSSKILLYFVNDILDYSKMNAQELKLNFFPCNFHKIIDEVS